MGRGCGLTSKGGQTEVMGIVGVGLKGVIESVEFVKR